MEHKGYVQIVPGLDAPPRVVSDRDRVGVVASLHYDEQRYNLRRVIVSRTWYAILLPEDRADLRPIRDRAHFAADTRREVLASIAAHLASPPESTRTDPKESTCR